MGGPDCAGALLSEKPRTVMSWYRFDRAPSLRTAGRIVRLTAGAVDYNGIYGPWAAVLAERDGVAACVGLFTPPGLRTARAWPPWRLSMG